MGESLGSCLGPTQGAKFRNLQVGAVEAEPNWKAIGGRDWVPLKRPRRLLGMGRRVLDNRQD